jgi:ERCC4-type nuclease
MHVWASQPGSELAARLAGEGIEILPLDEDLGQVERYILSERAAVERRTRHTFLNGIVDKTLFRSAIELRERFEVAVLVVEALLEDTPHRAFHPQAVRGALSSMLLVYGLSVVATPDVQESAALIAMMARQEQEGVPEISLVPKRKAEDLPDMQRRVVEMLPRCGLTVTRNLLWHMGSIAQVAQASEEALRAVPGIGPKTASTIHEVLHATYGAIDTERDLEDAIEAAPELLFDHEVSLLARQHTVRISPHERGVIDMVFYDEPANGLVLVELKHGALEAAHEAQLVRYLAHAHQSPLLRGYLERGAKVRGVMATASPCDFETSDPSRVAVRIVDREAAIEVLKWLRRGVAQ